MALIRYPGSKEKIAENIIRRFPPSITLPVFGCERFEYREPFFGSGAVGFRALDTLHSKNTVWINDRDYGMACLWRTVQKEPDLLIARIQRFTPTVDAFYKFREEDAVRDMDVLETGFRKLALHQTSFSGLGARAGGPIGGRQQRSAYNVNCRWSATRLCRDVQRHHLQLARFARVQITARDFADLIVDAPPHAFIYADPPYVEKGGALYKHGMDDRDHTRLATMLRASQSGWVLSYDDHPLVRRLYSWATIESVQLTYTMAVASERRRKNSEVIITPRPEQKFANAS